LRRITSCLIAAVASTVAGACGTGGSTHAAPPAATSLTTSTNANPGEAITDVKVACHAYGVALTRRQDSTLTPQEWDSLMNDGVFGATGSAQQAAKNDGGYSQFAQFMADIWHGAPSPGVVAGYQSLQDDAQKHVDDLRASGASPSVVQSAQLLVPNATQLAFNYETQNVRQICSNEGR